MQVVQAAVKNKVRKQNKYMGRFDGEHGHCNRDLLCCHSRTERTIAQCIPVNIPVWKPHTMFSPQSIGQNQSQDFPIASGREKAYGHKHLDYSTYHRKMV